MESSRNTFELESDTSPAGGDDESLDPARLLGALRLRMAGVETEMAGLKAEMERLSRICELLEHRLPSTANEPVDADAAPDLAGANLG